MKPFAKAQGKLWCWSSSVAAMVRQTCCEKRIGWNCLCPNWGIAITPTSVRSLHLTLQQSLAHGILWNTGANPSTRFSRHVTCSKMKGWSSLHASCPVPWDCCIRDTFVTWTSSPGTSCGCQRHVRWSWQTVASWSSHLSATKRSHTIPCTWPRATGPQSSMWMRLIAPCWRRPLTSFQPDPPCTRHASERTSSGHWASWVASRTQWANGACCVKTCRSQKSAQCLCRWPGRRRRLPRKFFLAVCQRQGCGRTGFVQLAQLRQHTAPCLHRYLRTCNFVSPGFQRRLGKAFSLWPDVTCFGNCVKSWFVSAV